MIQLQIHYNVQTPILKSKEIQAIDPLEDTSNHRLQIFLLNSIHSFNLSFLKTLVHMACLQTTTHMEGFILVFHIVTPCPDTPAVGPDTPDMEFLVHIIFVLWAPQLFK